ncbi:hypothetical protein SCP_1302250 [Sparassis crispa]|uniref:Uncharacterized protein n=1 Tax=Sparassis crispa TaxID=139825 RepID=A0A401H225_9APHY|nr:hypothetical protein SCP_1302250 [Sparassis crispa]GBE88410.1 hypothetical protein SCP_1302250 [Sparassis crispa]
MFKDILQPNNQQADATVESLSSGASLPLPLMGYLYHHFVHSMLCSDSILRFKEHTGELEEQPRPPIYVNGDSSLQDVEEAVLQMQEDTKDLKLEREPATS